MLTVFYLTRKVVKRKTQLNVSGKPFVLTRKVARILVDCIGSKFKFIILPHFLGVSIFFKKRFERVFTVTVHVVTVQTPFSRVYWQSTHIYNWHIFVIKT